MNNEFFRHPDYDEIDAIMRRARMERDAAVGDAMGRLAVIVRSGLRRALTALKSSLSRSKSRRLANEGPILEASGHR